MQLVSTGEEEKLLIPAPEVAVFPENVQFVIVDEQEE